MGSGDPSGLQNRRELASLALVSSTLTRFRQSKRLGQLDTLRCGLHVMTTPKQTADTLAITYSADDGTPGTDSDPDNPLARALNSLLDTGRPIQCFSACYLNPLPMASGIRWFGTFVYSDGDRLIYFPGLAEMQRGLQTSKGAGPIKKQSFRVDHLSLEADRRDWHLTKKGSTGHVGRYPTTDLGDGRVLWFGLSIASPKTLRRLRTRTKVEAHIHPNDSLRRAEVFKNAREGIVYNTLMFNTTSNHLIVPGFAHFTVIVGPCGFADYSGGQYAFPVGSPYITPKLTGAVNIPVRSHRVSLEPHVDLQIIAAILPGAVTVPATFTNPVL
jgi:hypothetical protein